MSNQPTRYALLRGGLIPDEKGRFVEHKEFAELKAQLEVCKSGRRAAREDAVRINHILEETSLERDELREKVEAWEWLLAHDCWVVTNECLSEYQAQVPHGGGYTHVCAKSITELREKVEQDEGGEG